MFKLPKIKIKKKNKVTLETSRQRNLHRFGIKLDNIKEQLNFIEQKSVLSDNPEERVFLILQSEKLEQQYEEVKQELFNYVNDL